jgi:hypothetical protein
MRRIAVLIASAAINASTIPAVASECTSSKDIDASCARWAMVDSRSANAADTETICRAYAASFYESMMRRQVAARLAHGERTLVLLDSVINGFNDLLRTKCGS